MALCTVILPARNAEGTLRAAVCSLQKQSVSDWELRLIDDGSTDGTGALAHQLARGDDRIKVLAGEGRGIARALNLGLQGCVSPFVARMDADDESLPERFERSLAALLKTPSLAAVGTQVEIFRDEVPVSPNMQAYGEWLNSLTLPPLLKRERFIESPLCHPSSMLRRSALEQVGGWKDGDFPEDYELWLALLEAGFDLQAVEPVLFRWRDSATRLTRTDARYAPLAHVRLKAMYLAKSLRRTKCAVWGLGDIGRPLAVELSHLGVEVACFYDVSPKKIGQRFKAWAVRSHLEITAALEHHLLIAVGAKGARQQIREYLKERNLEEGVHFTCVA